MGLDPCDWDPEHDDLAYSDGAGCPNEAVWSVGSKTNYHLCDSCARLPRFKAFRKRVYIGGTVANQSDGAPRLVRVTDLKNERKQR